LLYDYTTRILSSEDFGNVLIFNSYNCMIFIIIGMVQSLVRFCNKEKGGNNKCPDF